MIITYTSTKVRHVLDWRGKRRRSREGEKQRSAGIRNNGIIRDRGEGGGKVEGGVDEQGGGEWTATGLSVEK